MKSMKKTFTLLMLALLAFATSANAQGKKTWDFTKGFSDQTIENLTADPQWAVQTNNDGSFKQANEATKMSGEFKANGEYIKELIGLSLGTAGLKSINNVIIFPKKFRINRDQMQINFPKLANGQTITIVGRSANSSAEDRGIKGSYDYMKLIEGPEDCLIKASLGEVTLKWKIESESSDSVPVQFTMIKGGVDFTLFMIDEGDAAKTAKVAYLYNGTADATLATLQAREATEVTPIDVTTTTVTSEKLQEYDVTVIATSVPSDNAAVQVAKEALPWTPTLNLNANLYPVWAYGEAVDVDVYAYAKNKKNNLLAGVQFIDDEPNAFPMIADFDALSMKAVKLGEYFQGDDIVAVDYVDGEPGENTVIHTHNISHNGYVFVPGEDPTEEAFTVINNAVTLLQESKSVITATAKPVISQEYKNRNTNVTITASRQQPKVKFYYTTNGSEPTVETGTEYTGTFNITEACTVKAVAIAEGYTVSEVEKLDINIYEQPATPAIAAVEADGSTTITLTCATEDVDIFYNFAEEATNDTLKSTKYTGPVTITMPQYVNAFAVAGGQVWSEVASKRVLVKNPRVVIDVAAHFQATQWTADNNPAGKSVDNGRGVFSWGVNALSMYDGEGTPGTDPETGDETIIYTDEDLRDYEVVNEPGDNPEWMLKSRGTSLIWQNLTPQTTNFGDANNYNPLYSTDVDKLFPVTKNAIQFYDFIQNEPANGSIETLKKYQAPLDVVVLTNMQGGPLVAQVSTDGVNWNTIGEIEKTGLLRNWSKYTLSYNGTDEVFVRVTQLVPSASKAGAKLFDIYIANQGETSLALLEQLNNEYATGILAAPVQQRMTPAAIYDLNGRRQTSLQRGINIVRTSDGKVRKVMVK